MSTTPIRSRSLSSTSLAAKVSPAYRTDQRRHSLYGQDDRIVIDFGASSCRAGYSGEPAPRTVFATSQDSHLWDYDLARSNHSIPQIQLAIKHILRKICFDVLMTDPRQRKFILVENPLLPTEIKAIIAQTLFENLQATSIAYTCGPLLSLLAVGRTSGLVVDIGHLETCILPIFHGRPLFTYLVSTPKAGYAICERLKALILRFARYTPSVISSTAIQTPMRNIPVPPDLITPSLVRDIQTRICYVEQEGVESAAQDVMQIDEQGEGGDYLDYLERLYKPVSTATPVAIPIGASNQTGLSSTVKTRGYISIPGWIRAYAAEVLFTESDVDALSVTDAILETVLQLPLDLRKPMISSILCTGGSCQLPNMIPRLRQELSYALEPTAVQESKLRNPKTKHHGRATYSSRFRVLSGLQPHLAVLNDPSPQEAAESGSAPAYEADLLPWIGGSLAGALKISGPEIKREHWDLKVKMQDGMASAGSLLGDWTRPPLQGISVSTG